MIVDNPREQTSPFQAKFPGPPSWIARTPQRLPLERYSLTWQNNPEAARRAHAAGMGPASPRRMQFRALLAGPRTRESFHALLGLLGSRPAVELPWSGTADMTEAIEEAAQVLAAWDDAARTGNLSHAVANDRTLLPWSHLLRHLVVDRGDNDEAKLRVALGAPQLADLVALEIRRTTIDLRSLAHSAHVVALRRLVLHDAVLFDDVHAALVRSPNLAGLTALTLSRMHLPPERLAAWLDGPPGCELRELVLRGVASSAHLDVLLARPALLAQLTHLGLTDGWLSDVDLLRLAACEALAGLQVLDLRSRERSVAPSAAALAALHAAPQLARAEILLGH